MPASYTPLGFILQATGENESTWGAFLNSGGLSLIDDAIRSRIAFTLSGSKTLTSTNGTDTEARKAILHITGGTGGAVTIPNYSKVYVVINEASGSVIITAGGATTATVTGGETTLVVSDGSNVRTLGIGGLSLKQYIDAQAFAETDLPGIAPGTAGQVVSNNGVDALWVDPSSFASTYTALVGGIDQMLFGDGSDGDATINAPVTLSRDMHYDALTLASGASINPAGFRIFARTLDLTNAPAGAIAWNGVAGNAASGLTGGAAAARLIGASTASLSGGAQNGPAGVNGTSNTGTGAVGTSTTNGFSVGGTGGAGGLGGNGSVGVGSAGGTSTISSQVLPRRLSAEFPPIPANEAASTFTKLYGGGAGASGGSAAGSAGGTGGGSGGGAAGAGAIAIFAKTIVRGPSTATGVVQAKGAVGGAGGLGSAVATGGGGGGGGSGGGFVYLVYRTLSGPVVADLIDVTGGNGGAGGAGVTTGTGGAGGQSGQGGRVLAFNLATGDASEMSPLAAVAGSASVGTAGGAGGVAPASQVDL